ncbi:MAG: hypothetical protein WCK77_16570 [Verrucomicrobiota bacterium]
MENIEASEHSAKINAYFLTGPPHSTPIRCLIAGDFADSLTGADSTAINRKKRPNFEEICKEPKLLWRRLSNCA